MEYVVELILEEDLWLMCKILLVIYKLFCSWLMVYDYIEDLIREYYFNMWYFGVVWD